MTDIYIRVKYESGKLILIPESENDMDIIAANTLEHGDIIDLKMIELERSPWPY